MGQQVHTLIVGAADSASTRDIGPTARDFVGRIQFEITGITAASGSCTPQVRGATSAMYYDKVYQDFPTEAVIDAGTAITADGIYEMLIDGCVGALNIATVGSAGWTVKVTPLVG